MKIAFVSSPSDLARESHRELEQRYGSSSVDEADFIVTLGGDGLVLKTFDTYADSSKPIFALNRTTSVGFLCNQYRVDDLPDRLEKSKKVILHPLRMECVTADGQKSEALALNEIAVLRDTPQSARLRILVDGIERIARYSGDGMIVATPAGSTAYNHSAGGPIMPLDANTLVMTAICGFRPRRWNYAVLPQSSVIDFKTLESSKRPVRIEAGQQSIHNVLQAKIWMDHAISFTLLFDPELHLGERIVQEQFMT
jgi:NAD+ kinase